MATHAHKVGNEQLLELVSPRVGLIRSLTRLERGPEEPNPPIIYHSLLSHFDFHRADDVDRSGVGKGETEEEAVGGAIGEAVERYCSFQPDPAAILRAAFADLGSELAIHPAECVLYSESQYNRGGLPYHRFEEQSEAGWVRGRALPSEDEVLIPAFLTYLNYLGERPEEYICAPTSNGLAAGPDLDSAILGGLYELVERDGYLITWINKLPVPRVEFSHMGGLSQSIRRHYRRFGIDVHVFNVTSDIPIYVMMGIAIDRSGGGPAAVVGLGCSLDPTIAVKKALLEVCQIHPGETVRYRQEPPQERIRSFEDVRTMEDHGLLFTIPRMLEELDFLLESPRTQRIDELPDLSNGETRADLNFCVDMLTQAGSRVAYADLTTPDLAPFGLHVVRTIATKLQPIHFGYREERLGGQRLFEIPHKLGYASEIRTESDINLCPHPIA